MSDPAADPVVDDPSSGSQAGAGPSTDRQEWSVAPIDNDQLPDDLSTPGQAVGEQPADHQRLSATIDSDQLQRILEAALLAAGKPLSVQQLAELFEAHERPDNDQLRAALGAIQAFYQQRGFELKEVASGYRFQVVATMTPWVSRLWEERPQRYSRALLETLALIAYRQPITRGDIEEIRGVAVSSNIVKTLLEREWIRVVGHKDVPGRPAMYATTRKFLDYFNLKNLDDLPSLAELRDLDSLNAELALEGVDTVLPEDDSEDTAEAVDEFALVADTDPDPDSAGDDAGPQPDNDPQETQ